MLTYSLSKTLVSWLLTSQPIDTKVCTLYLNDVNKLCCIIAAQFLNCICAEPSPRCADCPPNWWEVTAASACWDWKYWSEVRGHTWKWPLSHKSVTKSQAYWLTTLLVRSLHPCWQQRETKVASWNWCSLKMPQTKVVPNSAQYLETRILVRLPIHNLNQLAPMLTRIMHKFTIQHFLIYCDGFRGKKSPCN
jgi:hypothetical protein